MRPVILYGGLADVGRENLLHTVPELFEAPPQNEADGSTSGIVKVITFYSFIHSSFPSLAHTFHNPFTSPFVGPFFCSLIYVCFHSFTHPFLHLPIHSIFLGSSM